MPLSQIVNLLSEVIGLDSASVGLASIERSVHQRLAVCHVKSIAEYLEIVQRSPKEFQELIEAVVVPETWFFRHPESFTALRKCILERNRPGHVWRFLSVPCSTGEEPYSIAMTLVDLGFAPGQFQLDAVDISAQSLERAKAGVFRRNSFRNRDVAWRERFFQETESAHQLDSAVQSCVRFHQGNLLDEAFFLGAEPYDFIFCRNLLIYFDVPTQARGIKKLRQLLAHDGVLFVGPAEPGLYLDHNFVPARLPLAFAMRLKSSPPQVEHSHDHRKSRPKPVLRKSPVAAVRPNPASPNVVKAPPPTPEPVPAVPNLDQAARLADEGRMLEAAEICESSIRQQGPSARAYYLLGLVRDVAGDTAAASQYYSKTLYLEPSHYEALMHLVFINEKNGNRSAAAVFKARAGRLAKREAGKTS